ncbi:protein MULTIPLE CHLOROPLAST DIVISION SITE 1-like [Bidens hawaiensis]|uniref:protein MULTIPLE CHLOROPLAST DIVISION SITE 1-like n=1 Tax=Bidens hawaiensis TaxID=980011 RepID=UPI0040494AFB
MASSSLQLHPISISIPHRVSTNAFGLKPQSGFNKRYQIWKRKNKYPDFFIEASASSSTSGEDKPIMDEVTLASLKSNGIAVLQRQISKLQQTIVSSPPVVFLVKNSPGSTYMLGFCIATTALIIAVRVYLARKSRHKRPGSVADLVRRGQLNSGRGISKTVMYDDPFNNPQVKISKNNSTVEMCGKVYKLAPVTLTQEEQNIHQKRRSRAYQWKRPTIFLKEGDPIPADVDPDTVRWIPANHPFATTINDITEDLAQKNVYQKHGVPFRIQAEHEALQKKLEALQSDQKLNNMVIDPGTARNFERPFKSNNKLDDQQQVEQKSANGQTGSRPESQPNSNGKSASEEKQTL